MHVPVLLTVRVAVTSLEVEGEIDDVNVPVPVGLGVADSERLANCVPLADAEYDTETVRVPEGVRVLDLLMEGLTLVCSWRW